MKTSKNRGTYYSPFTNIVKKNLDVIDFVKESMHA